MKTNTQKMDNKEFRNLKPRTEKHGLTMYPAIIKGKQVWVTIPSRENEE